MSNDTRDVIDIHFSELVEGMGDEEGDPEEWPTPLFWSMKAHHMTGRTGLSTGVGLVQLRYAYAPAIYDHTRSRLEAMALNDDDDETRVLSDLTKFVGEYLTDVEARYRRVVRLLIGLSCYTEPEGVLYRYVDDILAAEGMERVGDEYRDKLARLLFRTSRRLLEHVDAKNTGESLGDLRGADGMLWLDAAAIDWLEAEGWDGWSTGPEGGRNAARTRWDNNDGAELLALWVDPDEPIPWKLRPLETLGRYLWRHEVKPEWDRLTKATPARVQGLRHGQDQDLFGKFEKAVAATTARGRLERAGAGEIEAVDINETGDFTIDGERYSDAPGVLRVIPQTLGVTPTDFENLHPYQVQLPLSLDGSRVSLALRVYADSQVILRPTAAKLLVALHLLAPSSGELGTVPIGALTEWLNKGRARPGRKRNREQVRDNAYAIRGLGIPTRIEGADDALSHNVQMLEVHPPESTDKNAEIKFGRTRGFHSLIQSLKNAADPWKKLNGAFVMNADGFMRISGQDSDAARMYLTLCAFWNDRRWDPDRMAFLSLHELAILANTLSMPARKYLDGEGGNAPRLRKDRSKTEKAVAKLVEEYRLVGELEAKGSGRHRELRILPTEEHREAWNRIRSNPPETFPI